MQPAAPKVPRKIFAAFQLLIFSFFICPFSFYFLFFFSLFATRNLFIWRRTRENRNVERCGIHLKTYWKYSRRAIRKVRSGAVNTQLSLQLSKWHIEQIEWGTTEYVGLKWDMRWWGTRKSQWKAKSGIDVGVFRGPWGCAQGFTQS